MSGFTHFNEDGNAVMVDVREKYDFCLHIESLFLLMRIGPVFLMGFCINVITVRLHRKFHIKDKDVF